MLNSFSTALSGLSANALSLSVIGNNLANLNTVAYKANIAQFQDVLARTVLSYNGAGNPMQVGLGVKPSAIATSFQQGSLQTTGQPADVAVVGPGFFVVKDQQAQYYTRAGNFTLDAAGHLLTQDGQRVQGFPVVNGQVDTNGGLVDVIVDPGTIAPAAETSTMRTSSNVDAEMLLGTSFSASVQVVDSLGASHIATIQYTRNAPAAPGDPPSFAFDVTVDGADVPTGTAGVPYSLLTNADAAAPPGTMLFDSNGRLASVDPGTGAIAPATDFPINVTGWTSGGGPQTINFDLINEETGESYLTAYASPSSTSSTFQDGNSAANLLTFSVDPQGVVQGIFGNGETLPLGQLAIAQFNNPQGLVRIGANNFSRSQNSGEPSIGIAGSGGRGNLSGGTLELSNVDIANEFTNLIIAQRSYSANARMVTTTDEILQETINLKR